VELTPQPGQRKLLKRMRYVSPALLRAILAGDKLDAYADEGDASRGRFVQDGKVWLGADEVKRLPQDWQDLTPATLRAQKVWDCDAVDRVAIDRASSASAVYRAGRTTYAPGCGLWLGVQWPGGVDADAKAQLETLLAHLGDQGLGGDRSVGYGQFCLKEDAFSLDLPAPDGARALTLARYLPHEDELPDVLGPGASYGLVNVVGWLGSPQGAARRRKGLRMLAEGSVLPTATRPAPWGRLENVAPDDWHAHPVWRYGYACPAGVRAPVDAPDSDASPEVAHA
jgi:CRISPR-associated protein Csm4